MVEQAAPSMRALERGLAVLKSFTSTEGPVSISELARRTGFDRAVIRRILGTLESLGYVTRRNGGFMLLPSVLELGYAYLSSDPLPGLVEPRLEPLAQKLQESCSFGVLEHNRVVYLVRAQIKRISGPSLAVGSVMEPHLTSIGQTLLAHLDEHAVDAYLAEVPLEPITPRTITTPKALRQRLARVRQQGWCLVDQELELGLLALAAPVRASDGRIIGAVNITSHTSRTTPDDFVEKMLPELHETAAQIETDLRHAHM
ncbi:IclR family transcriptional regulator domain-containing protein [Pseudonocardia zijingensis]|uniref:IclR family transcriptional regulator C-terminal domain-containing protein n=1 Tax=Pseudonocardia zijingensis TaxID=153376 RepID=A0ABN1Q355_9PSEU